MTSTLGMLAVSFVIAMLSGMGMGGGGLMAVLLRLLGAESQLTVQGLNLLFFLFSSGAALCVHLQSRRIYFGAVAILLTFGILGTLLGSALALLLDGAILRRIFGGMLVASGIFSLLRDIRKEKSKSAGSDR